VSVGADRAVRSWEAAGPFAQAALHGQAAVRAVATSPDGRRLASADAAGVVRVWDDAAGRELLQLKGLAKPVTEVAFSPDGKRVAAGGADGVVKVWSADTGRLELTLRGHAAPIRGLGFDPRGRLLASASADGGVRLWAVDGGAE